MSEQGMDNQCDDERVRARLEQVKLESWSHLLIKSARLIDAYMLEGIRQQRPELAGLRRTHMMLFAHIELDGTRLTVLAERLGISKQAAGQLVDELEEMGVLERVADPRDGRARLIRFVRSGQGVIEGVAWMRAAELELEQALSEGAGEMLASILPELIAVLEQRLGEP